LSIVVVLAALAAGVAVSFSPSDPFDRPAFPLIDASDNTTYISRPLLENKVLAIYNNRILRRYEYSVMYGVSGSGKTTIVYNALNGKPGVISLRVWAQHDSKKMIVSKMYRECGLELKEDEIVRIDDVRNALHNAMERRNGIPLTVVFQVEGEESSNFEVLSHVEHLAEEFASVANVLVVLSGAVGILGLSNDEQMHSIFVDEMTREDAEEYVRRNAPGISSEDFTKFADLCGTMPLDLAVFCSRVGSERMDIDACIAWFLRDAHLGLLSFRHQKLLVALKSSPDGVSDDRLRDVVDDGVRLNVPIHVAPAMMWRGAIMYDPKQKIYKLAKQSHKTVLKTYEPYKT